MDDGSAQRTYIYVGDAVDMMMNVLYNGEHEVYNIGGNTDISIQGLAANIGSILGKKVVLGKGTGVAGAPRYTRMSINRYVHEFGAPEFTPLEEGLKRTIEYQKKLYAAIP